MNHANAAMQQRACLSNTARHIGHYSSAASGLSCIGPLVLLMASCAFTPASLADATHGRPAAAERGGDDAEETYAADDGSRALEGPIDAIDIDKLEPITLDEEQTLLGDWGDTENED